MAKDILTIDREKFRGEITRISFGGLKNLLEGLFCFIQDNAARISFDQLVDLERKQTIIWAELKRRGKLTNADLEEFHAWLYKKHNKKVF